MLNELVINKVKQIMQNNGIVIIDRNLELEFDSLQFITLVMDLEIEFEIEIPPEKLIAEEFATFEIICEVVDEEIKNKLSLIQ